MSVLTIQNAIIAKVTAEAVDGGKLASVALIGKTAYPGMILASYPYVGVEIGHREEDPGANNEMKSTIQYLCSVYVHSDVSLDDAYAQREALLDDGNGNGLENVLRSIVPQTDLGAWQAYIREVRYESSLTDGRRQNGTEWIAMAVIRYEVKAVIFY